MLIAGLNPATLNPVLAAPEQARGGTGWFDHPLNPPSACTAADAGGAPSKLYVEVKQPVKIPLAVDANGAASPDWSKAGDATVQISLDGDAVVEGVVLEDARATGGGAADGDGRAARAEGNRGCTSGGA